MSNGTIFGLIWIVFMCALFIACRKHKTRQFDFERWRDELHRNATRRGGQ